MNNTIISGAPQTGTPDLAHPYNFTTKDRVIAGISLIIGFLFWEWNLISIYAPTLGVFMVLTLINVTSFCYMKEKGIRQSKSSTLLLCLTAVSSCYFLIFDNTPVHFFMLIFALLTYVAWVMSVRKTSIMKKLNGFILGDYVNQIFVIPFNNFSAFFRSFISNDKPARKTLFSLVIGIVISIPLIFLIINLLMHADHGFGMLVEKTIQGIWDLSVASYVLEFLFGIPVACYCYGFLYGNYHKRKSDIIKYDNVNSKFISFHTIPRPAVFGPIVILNIIYIVFFVAMANYLFSAFAGELPLEMTYAEYARKGFFELCAIAAINLSVLVFAYTFIKRQEAEYPKTLKILTGSLSLFTLLLVITAMSKMLLYISSYGLTRLRMYTFWFMIVIIFIFILIIIWHVKKFNIGKPLITGCIILFLALGFSNTDGLIAKYNIESYEKGSLSQLDTEMLYNLSDAVSPYVSKYIEKTHNTEMKLAMIWVLDYHKRNIGYDGKVTDSSGHENGSIFRFNIQKYLAEK